MYKRLILIWLFLIPLCGCGTYVPEIQEDPGDASKGQLFVSAIALNANCELQNAVYSVVQGDKGDFKQGHIPYRLTSWLDDWGVQTTLNLTTDENGSVSPVASWLPPGPMSSLFTLNASVTASADAMRINKIGSYMTIKEILARGPCLPQSRPGGLFLMQSDLKLKEWLSDVVMLRGTSVVELPTKSDGPLKQDVISHEVKFVVVTSGAVTPGLKQTHFLLNQTGTFLSVGRTRTHDLLITFGPAQSSKGDRKKGPSLEAANSHLASEIGVAVANSLRAAQLVP